MGAWHAPRPHLEPLELLLEANGMLHAVPERLVQGVVEARVGVVVLLNLATQALVDLVAAALGHLGDLKGGEEYERGPFFLLFLPPPTLSER